MSTTIHQDADFVAAVIDSRILEASIKWIRNNMSPEEVFSANDLAIWAKDNGFEDQNSGI